MSTSTASTQQSTADILLTAMATLTNAVASLVSSVTGFTPKIDELIAQSKVNNETTETLIETLDKDRQKRSKLAYDPPEKFDGTPENAIPFGQACAFYFKAKGEEDGTNKITFALSRIKGGTGNMATAWANQQRALILETLNLYASWDEFATALKIHFSLQNDEAEAIHTIRSLEMMGSCKEYTTLFKTYQTRCGYNNVALIEEYR